MSVISLKAALEGKGYNVDALEEETIFAFQAAVNGLARAAQSEWIRLASEKLKSSRDIYIQGLRQAESFKETYAGDEASFEIQLVGEMPNNLEFGMPSFDMKSVRPGWLGGGKEKTAKDGHKYIRIPFRHSISSSPRFADSGQAKLAGLKTQLRAAVKTYGLNRALTAAGGEVATRRIPNGAPVHPFLKGLQKTEVAKEGPTGKIRRSSTLTTWRVMSEKSPADAWIHPGLNAANLMSQVESWAESQVDKIIDTILGD